MVMKKHRRAQKISPVILVVSKIQRPLVKILKNHIHVVFAKGHSVIRRIKLFMKGITQAKNLLLAIYATNPIAIQLSLTGIKNLFIQKKSRIHATIVIQNTRKIPT